MNWGAICTKWNLWKITYVCTLGRYQNKIWKSVKIHLAHNIFYKMNTDNDALLKFWFYLVHLITKQVQSWKNLPYSWRVQLWTCFVIKPLLKWNQNLSKASLSVFILQKMMSARSILTNLKKNFFLNQHLYRSTQAWRLYL